MYSERDGTTDECDVMFWVCGFERGGGPICGLADGLVYLGFISTCWVGRCRGDGDSISISILMMNNRGKLRRG